MEADIRTPCTCNYVGPDQYDVDINCYWHGEDKTVSEMPKLETLKEAMRVTNLPEQKLHWCGVLPDHAAHEFVSASSVFPKRCEGFAQSKTGQALSVAVSETEQINWERKVELEKERLAEEAEDNVNHPKHYGSHPSGVECITITEHMNFNVGNAVKYLWRAGLKKEADWPLGDIADKKTHLQDLKKAEWYIKREIERLSK